MALAIVGAVLTGGTSGVRAGDGPQRSLSGEIVSDGSSTVGPLTQAVAEEFNAQAPDVQISVDISGTGGGFERFCPGETDVQNASRPIDEEEIAICAENGVDWYEFEVAFDGITVVTNPENTLLECLTTEQLASIWQKDGAQTWADVNAEWPAETINLYGPGTDSGTFDYFVETILGETEIRQDFTPSEDDNVLVEGVSGDANSLGYFGAAYYEENQDILKAVAIDNGERLCDADAGDDPGWDLRSALSPAVRLRARRFAGAAGGCRVHALLPERSAGAGARGRLRGLARRRLRGRRREPGKRALRVRHAG